MFESDCVPITELAKETEQYLLQKGYKNSTLGVYKATWNKFIAFSNSEFYSKTDADTFLRLYFGIDVHSVTQKLDGRMRHALRHMNALNDYFNTGAVPRKKMRRQDSSPSERYELFSVIISSIANCKITPHLGLAIPKVRCECFYWQ